MMELRLDRRQVGKDVGVVILQVIENRGTRPIVDELGALITKRRIVFVRLDHE